MARRHGTISVLTIGTIGSKLLRIMQNPIDIAIKAAGSGPKLGEKIGVTGRAIYKWRAAWNAGNVRAIPATRAVQIEQAVGLDRHVMRPDLWPTPSEAA
jgi:DNA-binding transcriptional regulator YdaS (Cro superfamily)